MKILSASLLVTLGTLLSSTVRAESSELRAELVCEHAATPGRVVCELSTRATRNKLVWGDALVLRAPSFARPLRSRVAMHVAASADSSVASGKLALVAVEPGRGNLELLARAVVCRPESVPEVCEPEVLPVVVVIQVGEAMTRTP